ncbi:ABC transporter substrate-binding protein [Pseudactinotalea suaedae]|uniref:ABC transporter substrate-binding protein n=1 Tax=Pseudactinotalea suaedae TaxID=1524924 RepID=UPI0012E324A0|nr:ABC transporter substrate-binding protein [Pseudactinotalea suaedae]
MNPNKSLSRRRLLTLGGGVAAGLTLAACGTGPASNGGGETSSSGGDGGSSGGGGTLELWGNTSIIGEADSPLAQAAAAFGEEFGVTVNLQGIPTQDLVPKLTTTAAGGSGPDIAIVDVSSIAQLAAGQVLADISSQSGEVAGDFPTELLAGASYDGKQYGLPYTTNNVALYYNKAMLDSAGIAVPTTWDELRDAAIELTGGEQYGYMFGAQGQGAFLFWPWLWQNGGQIVNDDMTAAFASDAGIEAFEFYAGMAMTDKVAPPEFIASNASWDQYVAPFAQERVAMMAIGPWGTFPVQDANPDLDFGIAPLPSRKESASVLGGAAVGVGHHAQNAEMAWEFVRWMTGSEQMHYIQDTGNVPGRTEVVESDWAKEDPLRQVFIEQIPVSRARPAIPTWGDVEWGVMANMWDSVIQGQAAPADALLAAVDEANNALSS